MAAAMLAAPGVRCICSDVPRSKSDRVRVENGLTDRAELPLTGADDVRTVFWRTTPQFVRQTPDEDARRDQLDHVCRNPPPLSVKLRTITPTLQRQRPSRCILAINVGRDTRYVNGK
jgi:hypothetical protein